MKASIAVSLQKITRTYGSRTVLDQISCSFPEGSFTMITGTSGRGKSTLLRLIGLLDPCFTGEYHLFGREIAKIPASEKNRIRNQQIGFIFQNYHLIPGLNAFYNILLPGIYAQQHSGTSFLLRCRELAEMLALEPILNRDIRILSGGEQQRIAIARSLLMDPSLILADEPTGNLDPANTSAVMHCFKQLQENGKTIIMVTHDESLLQQADSVIVL